MRRSMKRFIPVFITGVLVAVFLMSTAGQASAATQVAGCFGYAGVNYNGLGVRLEYLASDGKFYPLQSSPTVYTSGNGCAAFDLYGSWTALNVHLVAFGWVPNWRGFFLGTSPQYATPGNGPVSVGTGQLSFYLLPHRAPDPPVNDPWTMKLGPTNCNVNAAMAAACSNDANGIHGNVVVVPRDSDGDNVDDRFDNYPGNKYRH